MEQQKIKFTRTEREILIIIKANPDINNPQIADAMFMMKSSIGQKLRSIYAKLGYDDVPDREKRTQLNEWLQEDHI